MASPLKRFITNVVIPIILVLGILLSLPSVCGHGHDHGHGHAHDHGHGHAHDTGHGHAHDNGHGHAHDNGHGHAHDHGHGHAHQAQEEPASFKWSRQANEHYAEQENGQEKANGHGHAHNHEDSHGHHEEPKKSKSGVWLEAIGATLLISIAPYIILFFVPVTNSKEHEPYLKVLLAFASGGLLGDAFLHLIPHAMSPHSSGEDHSHAHSHGGEGNHGHGQHTSIGLNVLGGIIVFLVVEKLVRIFKAGHSHSHSHSHGTPTEKAIVDEAKKKKDDDYKADEDDDKKQETEDTKEEALAVQDNVEGDIKVAGYLNLAADFTHNFTDGLAIGASFLAGKNVGIITTVTIFLHEIPHEIGDFAILLQSGCSRKQAMKLQLVTALGALCGCIVSLLADGADESAIAWILPFTAGGFIYIATVSVIPELLENTTLKQSVAEVLALMTGVALMIGITQVEEMGHEH